MPGLTASAPTQTEQSRLVLEGAAVPSIWSLPILAQASGSIQVGAVSGPMATYVPFIRIEHKDLVQPVWARLTRQPEGLILTDLATGIFGVGTAETVIKDFIAALREDAEVLADAHVPLSAEMQHQLTYLQSHLA